MRVPNRQTRRTGIRLLAVGAALALLLAACGGDDDDDDAAASATTTTTASQSESTTSSSASGGTDRAATVAVATTSLGDVLVNESGRTLYVFDKDTAADTSTCTGQCATTWPPLTLTAGDIVLGDGLDDSMFTTFARDDGAMQVSVNGHPLYTYAADTKAGDTNGQGVGGIWYVVGANGQKLEAGEAQGASTSSSGDAGY